MIMSFMQNLIFSLFQGRHITNGIVAIGVLLGICLYQSAQCQDSFLGFKLYPASPGSNCHALAFSRDSKQLFVGNTNGKNTVVEIPSLRTIKSFKGPEFLTQVVLFPSGDILAGVCWDFEDVKLWNTANWTPLPPLHTQQGLRCIAVSPDGKTLAVGCHDADRSILLFDLETRKLIHALKGHIVYFPCSLSFSPDSTLLASAAGEIQGSPVVIWDINKGERVKVIISHATDTNHAVFLPDGKRLASSGVDSPSNRSNVTVKIWDVESGTKLQTLTGYTSAVLAMIPLAGDKLVTGDVEGNLSVWDLKTSREIKKVQFTGLTEMISSFALSPDGQYLAVAMGIGGKYKVWKVSELISKSNDTIK